MNKTYLALGAVAVVIAAVVGLNSFWSPRPEPVRVPSYLEKASGETILPPASREEIQRRVQFAPDGFTRERLVVFFANGDVGVTVFNPDRSAIVFRFYPPGDGFNWKAAAFSEKGMKSRVERAADGKTVMAERHWYEDGTLKRLGQRLPAGGYQVTAFFGDGVTMSESTLFSNTGVLEIQSMYYQTGILKSVLKSKYNGLYKDWVSYFPDGKKSAFHIVEGNTERGEFYYEDGVTVRIKFMKELISRNFMGVSVVTAVYNNADGTLNHTRIWDTNSMKVSYPAANGKPAFTQIWRYVDAKKAQNRLAIDNFQLQSVSVARLDGIDNVDISLGKDQIPVEIRFVRKNDKGVEERITRKLRADGTVESESVASYSGGRVERKFTGEEGGRVIVPADFFAPGSYEAPPSVPSEFSYYPGGYR
jgi:antitoxin component YwqK of YwqJK toxin-antitoxin module